MEVQKIAIERAIRFLNSSGCKYCILEADGTKHGTLEVAIEKQSSRAASRFHRGALLAHYLPYVKDLQSGNAVLIPYGSFGIDDDARSALRGAVSSWCSAKWGNKTYITHCNATGVEVLRVD